jgi:poly(3-hydroxybutyrate) depolymerase
MSHEQGRSAQSTKVERGQVAGGRAYTRSIYHDASGHAIVEKWLVHQAGHVWSGGSSDGSFTDPRGPDASNELLRFFTEQSRKR